MPKKVVRLVGFARTKPGADPALAGELKNKLLEYGCRPEDIYIADQTDASMDDEVLKQAVASLRPGDGLVLDRLQHGPGRLSELVKLSNSLKLRGNYLDLPTMGISTNVEEHANSLQSYADVIEQEHELWKERQKAGMEAARRAGKYEGRAKAAGEKSSEILRLKREGKSVPEIVRELSVSRATVYRVLQTTK